MAAGSRTPASGAKGRRGEGLGDGGGLQVRRPGAAAIQSSQRALERLGSMQRRCETSRMERMQQRPLDDEAGDSSLAQREAEARQRQGRTRPGEGAHPRQLWQRGDAAPEKEGDAGVWRGNGRIWAAGVQLRRWWRRLVLLGVLLPGVEDMACSFRFL